jgi:demethoxyubiquinone hydroxylase (CLK1/Coq7/Cat5 family)
MTINKLESEVSKIYKGDFQILTISEYKMKNILLVFKKNNIEFKTTADNWEDAVNNIFTQIKAYVGISDARD